MALILHVDDSSEWIDVVRHALADYSVDSAKTFDEALSLIRGPAPYALALIDLNLVGQDDGMGAEILDLLMLEFPETRRVVVTASPPAGGLRSGVFERYGLEDMLIKGKMTVPGLRMVVTRALRRDVADIPQEVKIYESILLEKYRDWHDRVEEEIRGHVRDTNHRIRLGARSPGESPAAAKIALDKWQALQESFASECARLDALVAAARTKSDVDAVSNLLDELMSRFTGELKRIS